MSEEKSVFKFIDLFAGMGGFHVALSRLGHECVFASEIDDEMRGIYLQNFPGMEGKVYGDIRESKYQVPDHDFLCAGFPCQPFSKSGGQLGTKDETRGTLFHEILEILELKMPKFVLLENVGNFGRHDDGRTWKIVKDHLTRLGYDVAGTEHLTSAPEKDWRDVGISASRPNQKNQVKGNVKPRGHGLISPHHFGFPHHRERFFVYATLGSLTDSPFPIVQSQKKTTLNDIVQNRGELSVIDQDETGLTIQQRACIDHWDELIKRLPVELVTLPPKNVLHS